MLNLITNSMPYIFKTKNYIMFILLIIKQLYLF